ncbi:putative leucine-rich repeat-containing protein DDB_G0290503 isoform X2 [Pseudochaenichthys georgianus]|uniref:putative leucine-rich repeat-containing protein DDB_G0290503 isoform X2 n=1 Tax=Pseudochaenichthys georgianus TaxID=52239 RepID=UPI00146BDD34|nr:putative leucine-rich repeat-containing protein DDB_G0290503 isoform X2 [Pseudochaenichthys georgianus]
MADRTPVRRSQSLISFQSFYEEQLLQQSSQSFFGSWHAPMFASAHTDVVQGHNNGEDLAMSPKSSLQPLDQVLLSAEEEIKKQSLEEVALREEIAKMALKQVSTSKALEELMGFQTQANMEKEEMVSKLNQMEEDFNKEKTTWSGLSSQRLEEISSLGTELSVARSHIDHLKEENAKLTMKNDSTSEAFKELKGLQTQAKMEKGEMVGKLNEVEEDLTKEKISLRTELSVVQSHINHLNKKNAKLTMKNGSTSEAFKELKGLQTQAKMEKRELLGKLNEVEEDLTKENISLRTELSVVQSHIDHLNEENAKLTMTNESTSEAFKELMGLQTQAKMEKEEMEAKINEVEEDFKKEKTSLRTELSDAQSLIDRLKDENAKLTMKDDSTSEDLEELMGLQTLAKTEMEAKVNRMEEDFNKEKTCLRTELSVVQSHIDYLKEENAKLTIKDDSTSEAFEELMGLQTQTKMEKEEMEAKINQMEEDFNKEKTSLRTELSVVQSHIDHLKEENAKLTIKDDSTSEAFEELFYLHTQANEEKEEMEAKINQMEEDFNKEKTSLRTELSVVQSHIDHLKEENAKLTIKDDSTSEAFEELFYLHTQANEENEEMEAKINQMKEDFNKEKTTWSDLNCQRLEEISSLGTELLDAQSHIDHLKEEIAKLTMKDDSTSEAFDKLFDLQTQVNEENEELEAKINEMEEEFEKEKTSLKMELSDAHSNIDDLKEELLDSRREAEREITFLQESFSIQIQDSSATVDHWREVVRGTEEEAATTLRESKEAWHGRFKELEENIKSKGDLISSLIDKMRASADSHESQKSVESKHEALEETYETELTEKENSDQRRVAEMMLPKSQKKKGWKRRLHLRRQLHRATASTSRDGLI